MENVSDVVHGFHLVLNTLLHQSNAFTTLENVSGEEKLLLKRKTKPVTGSKLVKTPCKKDVVLLVEFARVKFAPKVSPNAAT
jgi:hypothetical protein